jgi:hypothetical protein
MRTHYFYHSLLLIAVASIAVPAGQAKDKKPKPAPKEPQDEIQVVGHVPLTGGSVTRFVSTQHYSSYYLYAEHDGGQLTLLDVTHTARPVVVAEMAAALEDSSASLLRGRRNCRACDRWRGNRLGRRQRSNRADHGFFRSAPPQSGARVQGCDRDDAR